MRVTRPKEPNALEDTLGTSLQCSIEDKKAKNQFVIVCQHNMRII